MNVLRSFKYVADAINSEDDIVEQLKILRKYRYRKGVRKFIDNLIISNQNRDYDEDSKYILYCIVKYYYGLDAKEVKKPTPVLSIITPSNYDTDKIAKLLDAKDNIIDQCKLLKEHSDSQDVQNYIERAQAYYGWDALQRGLNTEYHEYCINKYFFDLDVPEVQPPHIRLYASFTPSRKNEIDIYEDVAGATPFAELQKGDKIMMLNGPFKGLEATVESVSQDLKEINLNFDLFGEETLVPLEDMNKMRKIIDDK